eukprot:364588-Chlamydomonas_euryale.AAC.9
MATPCGWAAPGAGGPAPWTAAARRRRCRVGRLPPRRATWSVPRPAGGQIQSSPSPQLRHPRMAAPSPRSWAAGSGAAAARSRSRTLS